MKNSNVQILLDRLDQEDQEITGMVVFNIQSGEIIGSTFAPEYTQQTIEIEQLILDLETQRLQKLDPTGQKTWTMYSFSKKVVLTIRIQGPVFISCEYVIHKAPGAAIEDGLEIALMVNEALEK